MHSRGGSDDATGGGHRSSGVTPREFPVGGANFVRAHPRVSHGSALLTGWPRSRESAPLGIRRMQMTRHDDRQRSDRLGVRHASSADRRAGRGNVHEARIAVDLSCAGHHSTDSRFDGSAMRRHDDSQRSGRLAVTVGDLRVVDRVAASIASTPSPSPPPSLSVAPARSIAKPACGPPAPFPATATLPDPCPRLTAGKTHRRRRRSITFVGSPTTTQRGVGTQVPTSAERWAFA